MHNVKAFLLKTWLADTNAEVSRYIVVPCEMKFRLLAQILQLSYEWRNTYLYDDVPENDKGRFIMRETPEEKVISMEKKLQDCGAEGLKMRYKLDSDHEVQLEVKRLVCDYPLAEPRVISFQGNSIAISANFENSVEKVESKNEWERWALTKENEAYDSVKVNWKLQMMYPWKE